MGSTFWFVVEFESARVQDEIDEAERREIKNSELPDKKLKILLVDDNKINQKIGLGVLKPFDYDVVVAENGKEAIDMFLEHSPDIILMDVQMPVMDGFQSTREIRKLEKEKSLSHTTIVALTANAIGDEKERCYESGMDDFIAKPFKINDIKRVLVNLE